MIRAIADAVKFLEYFVPTPEKKHPGELGLLRMHELTERLGNPQLKYPTIHVGGTSGKGSTATIIASILATRFKVGLHTSPHLVRINERIQITKNIKHRTNNKEPFDKTQGRHKTIHSKQHIINPLREIEDEEFIALVNEIKPVMMEMQKGKYGVPSYFEIVTAMAFLYFAKKKMDIAVIEVGMGGRHDATNVVHPLVAVLTNVGLDHTEILGDTVEKIAKDKVGIVKPGMRVVSGVTQPSVVTTVRSKCNKQKVKLSLLRQDFHYKLRKIGQTESVFDYQGESAIKNIRLHLLGKHQVENAALAIRAIEELLVVGYQLSVSDIQHGLQSAFIPGRLEIVQKNPIVVLDGAHNPDKMKALVEAIKTIWKSKKVTAIIAIKEDKNAKEMLETLLPICSKIILTQYKVKMDQGEIMSYPPKTLARLLNEIDPVKQCEIITHPLRALQQAIKSSNRHNIILVTGSLYMLSRLITELKQ